MQVPEHWIETISNGGGAYLTLQHSVSVVEHCIHRVRGVTVAGVEQGNYPLTVGNNVLYPSGHELQNPHPGGYELRHSLRGHPFYVWRKPVPRISNQILDCVVYLYASVADAEAGNAMGGTGFLIQEPSKVHEGYSFTYCVTNSHVVRNGGTVLSLNTMNSGRDVVSLDSDTWVHHRDGDDVAVCALTMGAASQYKYRKIPTEMFLSRQIVEESHIGPGDDVYMAGRFVSHQGQQRNTPMVRFGNLSMMPWDPIVHPVRGIEQESFLVETRSLGGFSGSPVFLYRHPHPAVYSRQTNEYETNAFTWLLGVDWGHFPIYEPVKEKNKQDNVPEGWVVEANSGQMMVVPAWKIRELLDQEEVSMARERAEEEFTERNAQTPVVLDTQTESTKDANSAAFTRDDFEGALDRVSRQEKKPGEAS